MKLKILITLVCSLGIATHLIWPTFKLDIFTLALIVIGILPWTSSLIKSLELPGGFKIELQDVKAATDEVMSSPITAADKDALAHGESIPKAGVDSLTTLRDSFGSDPNLALVGVRIEIEKRLNILARRFGIDTSANRTIRYKLQKLEQLQVISPEVASGLNALVNMGNKAAHGAEVAPEAAAWVLDVGPNIVYVLNDIIDANLVGGRTEQIVGPERG